jgi:hypothetical protein
LPGGRNFGRKAQKWPEKNKVGWKNLWLNFTKRGRRKFSKEASYLSVLTNTLKLRHNFISFRIDPLTDTALIFCDIGRTFFQNWPNFFYVQAGKQFLDLATLLSSTLTGVCRVYVSSRHDPAPHGGSFPLPSSPFGVVVVVD